MGRRHFLRTTAIVGSALASAVFSTSDHGVAVAQCPSCQMAQMQRLQQQMQQYQAEMYRYEQDIAAKQAEIFKQFDENGDGRLFGPERSKYDRHMYHIRIGKQPNPFASVRLPGQPATPQSASSK